MLAKLERELERLVSATFDPQAVVDHSINCSLTAWHMVDWVWQLHFRANLTAQQCLAAQAHRASPTSAKNSSFAPKEFKKALFHMCDGLKACEDIAIGTKHVYPELTTPEAIEARLSARAPQPFVLGVSELGGGDILAADDGSVPTDTQYLPKIDMADGTTEEAIQLLDAVVLFWKQFLKDFAIRQD